MGQRYIEDSCHIEVRFLPENASMTREEKMDSRLLLSGMVEWEDTCQRHAGIG